MRTFLLSIILFSFYSSRAQYYYKDIIGTRESAELVKAYRANKVSRVVLTSYDADNTRSEDFYVEQQFSPASSMLKTISRSELGSESVLISFADAEGRIIRTIDSSNILVSYTDYQYNPAGQLVKVVSASSDSAHRSNEGEQHLWQWGDNKPVRMLRIKNKVDTTFVDFKLDQDGDVSEERETRKRITSEPLYYYYNDAHQLTDIVRFNKKANRLLPEYMFEYSEANQVIQKITVPANSFNYLIWRYQYNAQGLKTREAIYSKELTEQNKRKQLGRIDYQYFFGS